MRDVNRKHMDHIRKMTDLVNDHANLDEYAGRIFGRPIRDSWRIYRHITKEAVPYSAWFWSQTDEKVYYPGEIPVPNLEEFATILFHEVAHGWCYFHKDYHSVYYYPTIGLTEEEVCWNISRIMCETFSIRYQQRLARLGFRFCLAIHENNPKKMRQVMKRLPAHLKP